jgi:redox-sensitive bicupin YhaK (pirin superfamily)
MSAGSGIRHSEFNPSATEPTHLYQIWLLPREKGLAPSYHQQKFNAAERARKWQLVASPGGVEGSLPIEQDAKMYLADLAAGEKLNFDVAENRHAWLQVLRGSVELNGHALATSDAAALSDEAQLSLHASTPCELMLFDLS